MIRACILALSCLALAYPSSSHARTTAAEFILDGSGGYELRFDVSDRYGKLSIQVSAERGEEAAYYFSRRVEELGPRSVVFELPGIGQADLRLDVRKAETHEIRNCGRVTTRKGFLRGRLDFVGEERYTEAHREQIRAEIRTYNRRGNCGANRSVATRGTRPTLTTCGPDNGLGFGASVHPFAKSGSMFVATKTETSPGLDVFRVVSAYGPKRAFRVSADGRRAVARPPAPFSGTGTLRRGELIGDLSVSFPGASDVPLTPAPAYLQGPSDELNPCFPYQPN